MEGIRKTYKYRLYPNKTQIAKMEEVLGICCWVYNHFLQERIEYKEIIDSLPFPAEKKSLSRYDQQKNLTQLKKEETWLSKVLVTVLREPIRYLDEAFKSFFRRVKNGETPGFPKFRCRERFKTFTYSETGFKLNYEGGKYGRLYLSRIGDIKIRLHRVIPGEIRTCAITKENGKWYACFSVITQGRKLSESQAKAKIQDFVSDGYDSYIQVNEEEYSYPFFLKQSLDKLKKIDKKISKQMKGSKRRDKSYKKRRNLHEKIKNQRKDFLHNKSREIINQYGEISYKRHNIKEIIMNENDEEENKTFHDAAGSMFLNFIEYKAKEAGRKLVKE